MPVVRVTPATALQQIRQLGGELSRLLADAGSLVAAPQLLAQLEALQTASAGTAPFPIEVWVDDGTAFMEAATWLLGAPGAAMEQRDPDRVSVTGRVGARMVSLLLTRSSHPWPFIPGQLTGNVLVWLRCDAAGDVSEVEERALVVTTGSPTTVSAVREPVVVHRAAAPGILPRLFSSPPAGQAMDLLQADAISRALEGVVAIAGIAFDQELRGIRAKRALAQQRAAEVQGRQAPSTMNELSVTLRTRLQRTFAEFARGVDDRFSVAITASTSPLWPTLEERFAAIDTLEREPRVKTLATRLAADVEEDWLEALRSALDHHCVADLAGLSDMLRAAAKEAEKALADGGGPPVVVQFQHLAADRLERLIETCVTAQRKYQGELPKPGPFEYLSMARRYQTLGFMLLSAFGLSFLRSHRAFMVPMVVVLLSLGVLQMVHTVQRERAELLAKELEKVRELLRTESRRILADAQRAWSGLIGQHLSEQLPLTLGSVELSVRDHFNRLTGETAEARQRLQRQLQALELAERKLAGPQKAREGIAQAVAQARGELRQLIAAAALGAPA